MLQSRCGATRSRSGKPFTRASLEQHEQDCPACNPNKKMAGARASREWADEGINLELTMMIGGDLPDGAFWALAHELGEW